MLVVVPIACCKGVVGGVSVSEVAGVGPVLDLALLEVPGFLLAEDSLGDTCEGLLPDELVWAEAAAPLVLRLRGWYL